jgi:hypothetical protein
MDTSSVKGDAYVQEKSSQGNAYHFSLIALGTCFAASLPALCNLRGNQLKRPSGCPVTEIVDQIFIAVEFINFETGLPKDAMFPATVKSNPHDLRKWEVTLNVGVRSIETTHVPLIQHQHPLRSDDDEIRTHETPSTEHAQLNLLIRSQL